MFSRIEKLFPNHTRTHTVPPVATVFVGFVGKVFRFNNLTQQSPSWKVYWNKTNYRTKYVERFTKLCPWSDEAGLKPGYAWSIPSVHFPHSEFTCTIPPPREWLFLCKWRLSGAKKKGKSKQLAHIIIKQQILKSLSDSVSCFHRLNHSTDCWQTTEKKNERCRTNITTLTDTPPKRSSFHFIPTKKSTPQSASRDHHTPEIRALFALEALLSEI